MERLTSVEKEYIQTLCTNTNGYVKIHCGNNRRGNFVPAGALIGNNMEKYLTGIGLNNQNKMITQSTYKTKGSATLDNINTVCCLAVDVDYTLTDEKGNLLEPMDAWKAICAEIIERACFFPIPTYIEYSHRLRLVYMFEVPVCLRIEGTQARRSTIVWLNRITQTLADNLNAMNPKFCASAQSLTKSLRVPGSMNIKFQRHYVVETDSNFYTPVYKYRVCVYKPINGHLWDVHELSDYILHDLPDWYDDYKKRKNMRKKPLIKMSLRKGDTHDMLQCRLNFLENLQRKGWDIGFREVMCFLYWNFSLQMGMKQEEAIQAVHSFNENFKHPLPEKHMLQHSKPRKLYNYKTETLFCLLGVDISQMKVFGFSGSNKKEYDKVYSRRYRILKKIANHKKVQKKINLRKKVVAEVSRLRELGYTLAYIANAVKCSVSTVKRMLAPT